MAPCRTSQCLSLYGSFDVPRSISCKGSMQGVPERFPFPFCWLILLCRKLRCNNYGHLAFFRICIQWCFYLCHIALLLCNASVKKLCNRLMQLSAHTWKIYSAGRVMITCSFFFKWVGISANCHVCELPRIGVACDWRVPNNFCKLPIFFWRSLMSKPTLKMRSWEESSWQWSNVSQSLAWHPAICTYSNKHWGSVYCKILTSSSSWFALAILPFNTHLCPSSIHQQCTRYGYRHRHRQVSCTLPFSIWHTHIHIHMHTCTHIHIHIHILGSTWRDSRRLLRWLLASMGLLLTDPFAIVR